MVFITINCLRFIVVDVVLTHHQYLKMIQTNDNNLIKINLCFKYEELKFILKLND